MKSYPLYIDGREHEGQGWTYVLRTSAFLRDPREAFDLKRRLELDGSRVPEGDTSVVGRCAYGGDEENRLAIEAAARAARELRRFPLDARRAVATDFHEAVVARRDEFVDVLVAAEGHPRRLAEWEVDGVLANCCESTRDWVFDQLDQRHSANGSRVRLTRRPDGVVCVNPPKNSAGIMSAMGVAALFAGNALVVKAPRSMPYGVMWLYRELVIPTLERHGAPPGTVNLISADSRRTLRQWVRHPLVDNLFFVGDSVAGLKLGAECVAHGKKPVLELSGNDPLVIWRDADVDAAAAALCECFYGSTQICMVPKQAVVHPAVADELIERLLTRVREIRPGYPEEPDVLLSPVLKADRFIEFLAEAEAAGARRLSGGRRIDIEGNPTEAGFFFEPTVVRVDGLERASELRCVREETFFPLLPIVVPEEESDDAVLEAMIDFVEADEYGLRTSLWLNDEDVREAFLAGVTRCGTIRVNESHMGFSPPMATHGGTGRSGGPFGGLNYPALTCSHLQGVSVARVRSGRFDALREPAHEPVLATS